MTLFVNIYSAGRAYGGPEEGGWWYDCGTPVGSIPVEYDEATWDAMREAAVEKGIMNEDYDVIVGYKEWEDHHAAYLRDKARQVQQEWSEKYQRTGKRSSVLGGEDYDVVIERHFARPYPQEIPHYE